MRLGTFCSVRNGELREIDASGGLRAWQQRLRSKKPLVPTYNPGNSSCQRVTRSGQLRGKTPENNHPPLCPLSIPKRAKGKGMGA
jgi:hypothetical protein